MYVGCNNKVTATSFTNRDLPISIALGSRGGYTQGDVRGVRNDDSCRPTSPGLCQYKFQGSINTALTTNTTYVPHPKSVFFAYCPSSAQPITNVNRHFTTGQGLAAPMRSCWHARERMVRVCINYTSSVHYTTMS